MPLSTERKAEYFLRMKELMSTYPKYFFVEINNVGSKQIQETRIALRGTAEILMGKNTMMRKCIREYAEENPDTPLAQLEECCRGNVGFVFTNGDLGDTLGLGFHQDFNLNDGTYGVCERCGKPIGKLRLQAFPRATLCVSCKQLEERR